MLVPFYIVMRQRWGAIGLAIASAVAILIYVLLLGWLQQRHLSGAKLSPGATTLENVPGMLDAALRLAAAAAVATGVGLVVRGLLVQRLQGKKHLTIILTRATVLSCGRAEHLPWLWQDFYGVGKLRR